ncbi:MAG TPA: preprotein translocase subunit SecA [Candidatus Limnocylindria bacterium]|jgi:preprotein translocase subunit SecA|nr:preprotein translocase subunit SecA [Candidatus Limnocylindria bacterium]
MMKFISRLVDSNDREVRRLEPLVDEINALEPEFEAMSDSELRGTSESLRAILQDRLGELLIPIELREVPVEEEEETELTGSDPARHSEERREQRKRERAEIDAALDEVLPRAFAAVREAMKRSLGKRHYDVQLIGGVVLHRGAIAEMKTGEGKTFVAPLAAYLNGLTGRGVHVVTVNDYLAKRDAQWIGAVFHRLGMSVGSIQHDSAYLFDPDFPQTDERLQNLRPVDRQAAYAADVTYGTNNEFGFDYLRDNLVIDLGQRVQRGHFFAIVDEVDNILIDEARTPLIISGQAEESADKYIQFARLTPRLTAEEDYIIDEKFKQVAITEAGTDKMERWLGVDNLFGNDFSMARHLEQALKAEVLYQRDRDYVVKDGEVIIVDEFTGRLMPGRRWSEGLHQAVEAKEGVKIQNESRTLATVTFQNYFRMYDKLAGMTGTAETEAEEFSKIYGLEVVVIPTNRDMIRDDFADLVFRNQKGKWNAVIDEIAEEHEKGRPVLVGTISVAISEMLADMLKRRGIKHSVLNAKFHEKEAEIVAQAGRSGAVTIATNMAGRGTDILLGGNPEMLAAEILHRQGTNVLEATPEQYQAALAEADQVCAEDRDKVLAAGGLHIVGTERHEARRIDNQLRGRAGRQGDPGSSRFYLSLEDDLMRRFASDRVSSIMGRLGFDDETALESGMVSRTIEGAQTRVEGYNFDSRKHVVEYDDVINRQRETIYHERERILRSKDLAPTILAMLDEEVRGLVEEHTVGDASEWNRAGLQASLLAMAPTLSPAALSVIDDARDPAALAEQLVDAVAEAYDEKRRQTGDEGIAVMERIVLLRVIDSLWVEHLTAIDDMRRGIGLRAYSQRDPLNEFKVEAYRMFDELKVTIRHDVTHTIFRVSIQRDEQPQQPQPRRMTEGRIDLETGALAATGTAAATAGGGNGNGAGGQRPEPVRAGPKIGRNDPCWCGSGKKYKRCHGA